MNKNRSLKAEMLFRLIIPLILFVIFDGILSYFVTLHYVDEAYDRWLLDSAVIMNRYPHIVETLTLGSMIPSQEIPWWYFPSWFAAQVPLVALFLIFIIRR